MPKIPTEAPQWFKRWLLDFVSTPLAPTRPLGLKSYLSTALPDATDFPEAIIAVSDTGTVAYSDGVFWYPLTKGAHY